MWDTGVQGVLGEETMAAVAVDCPGGTAFAFPYKIKYMKIFKRKTINNAK